MRTVSYSEIKTWTTCRMKWWFSYQKKLTRRANRRTPQLGSACHEGMKAYMQGEDFVTCINEWAQKQALGLFEEELAELETIVADAINIIGRYIKNYQNDPFVAVVTERRFQIPLPGSINREPLTMVGYWDNIVKDKDGRNWVLERKFPTSFRSEESLLLDAQVGIYEWAANKCGYNVVGTIFDECLNKPASIPKQNKDGSMSRVRIATDWDTYKQALLDCGLDPANYAEMEEKLDVKFYKRTYVYRGKVEQEMFHKELMRKLWDMNSKHIFRAESQMDCQMCDFREPCIQMIRGCDVEEMLRFEFTTKEEKHGNREEGTYDAPKSNKR